MIPYIEVINPLTLKKITQVEPKECWFELSYYEVGEFEVYANATPKNLEALQKGRFIKIPNKRYIWYITAVKYMFNAAGARMISATGYEAKYLLNKRIIATPKELQGTITSAVYGLVNQTLGTKANAARKILGFEVDTNDLLIDISGTQAPRVNLMEFVNNLLKTYNCGSQVIYENEKLKYKILNGSVKTGSVKFSQSLDNLISSEYLTDDTEKATLAQVVSTVEEVDYIQTYNTGETGIDRAEILVSSNLNTKYIDANGEEQETTPTSELYGGWQVEEGKTELAKHTTITEVKGDLDLVNSNYEFETDYNLGDLVKVQDEYFNYNFNTRILKIRFKQNRTYGLEAEYGE